MSRTSPVTETLPEWEDADVQLVYEMLCDPELNSPPNPEEHWEGWVSRNIVRGLRSRRYAQTPAVSEADVIIVAARLRGLNALKEDYGQIQHEKVRKALEALSDTSTTREGK
jgi:hypothetical protein